MKVLYLMCIYLCFTSFGFSQSNTPPLSPNSVKKISIYPNPVDSYFFIDAEPNSSYKIIIYTAIGNVVLQKTVKNKTPIYVADLNKGVYIIKIFAENQVISKRLIKK